MLRLGTPENAALQCGMGSVLSSCPLCSLCETLFFLEKHADLKVGVPKKQGSHGEKVRGSTLGAPWERRTSVRHAFYVLSVPSVFSVRNPVFS